MPWCEDCAKFWNPPSMPPDGTCPTCGRVIAEMPDTKVPWHFWVLVVALVLYLGWRLIQLFQWLFETGRAAIAVPLAVVVLALAAWGGRFWWTARHDRADPRVGGGPAS